MQLPEANQRTVVDDWRPKVRFYHGRRAFGLDEVRVYHGRRALGVDEVRFHHGRRAFGVDEANLYGRLLARFRGLRRDLLCCGLLAACLAGACRRLALCLALTLLGCW